MRDAAVCLLAACVAFLFRGETRGCEDVCMGWCEGGACVERASSLMLFNRELRLHVTRQAVPLESHIALLEPSLF